MVPIKLNLMTKSIGDKKTKTAIFISGTGSNLENLHIGNGLLGVDLSDASSDSSNDWRLLLWLLSSSWMSEQEKVSMTPIAHVNLAK